MPKSITERANELHATEFFNPKFVRQALSIPDRSTGPAYLQSAFEKVRHRSRLPPTIRVKDFVEKASTGQIHFYLGPRAAQLYDRLLTKFGLRERPSGELSETAKELLADVKRRR